MNKQIKKLIILPIMLLVVFLMTTNVKAAGFNVTRTITGVTNTVSNTFTYKATADSSNPATVTPPSNQTLAMSGTISGNSLSTTKTLWADSVWTSISYPQPGTYKFSVKEISSSNPTTYPVDSTEYIVIVYVTNSDPNNPGTLQAQYIGAQPASDPSPSSKILGTSNAPFQSAAVFKNITVTKNVRGSGANANEYFKFALQISGSEARGSTYVISGQDSSISYGGSSVTVQTSYTVPTSGNSPTVYIYLKHGQTVTIGKSGTINQIPVGVSYKLVEQDATNYDTYINGSGTTSKDTGTLTISSSDSGYNNKAAFINENEPSVPTGLLIRIFPFVVLLVLSVIGLVAIKRTKKIEEV